MRRACAYLGMVMAVETQVGCGGVVVDEQPAPERTCPADASLHFRRSAGPWACLSADGPQGLVFSDEESWREYWVAHTTCDDEAPAMPFDEALLLGIFLEGDCEYSGCESVVPIVRTLVRDGCTLRVMTQPPPTNSLGPCNACVQPREFLGVERLLLEGVHEVVFEPLSP